MAASETKSQGSAEPSADQPADFKSLPIPQLEAKLGTSAEGLAQAEADKRLTQYGPNEIPDKKDNPLLKFLRYFWGPIPWMIEAAAILSAVVQHWADFIIIFMLLIANAVVGFWEEYQGRQRHCRAESQARAARAGETRRCLVGDRSAPVSAW